MTNTQDFTSFFKAAPAAIDTAAMTDAWKTWATFGERFSAIARDAWPNVADELPEGARPPLWFVQLGAFAESTNADRLRAKVAEFQLGQVKVQPLEANDGFVYRVRLGPLASQETAEQTLARLRDHGLQSMQIILD